MNVNRRVHRWGALLVALPLLLMIATGILLQLKKEWSWVQPPTKPGTGAAPEVSFDAILAAARTVPEAKIESWDDVDRVDVRPDKGVAKVRAKSRWEVQVDTQSGEVLQTAYRRSDFIESLHDGSWFGVKLWVFLPAAFVLLLLWVTGLVLWWQPHAARRRRRNK